MRSGGTLATLAGVVFLRVLGVSLLLPGFVPHAAALGGTVAEAGLAFGAYPLALALFMLPLAALSDRIGRRPVLVGGLAISAVGGLAAAAAPSVVLLGVGRFLQGAGAVNGVALAVAGELGPEDRRARRMALLGAGAGTGFAVGLVLGALLDPLLGVPGLLVLHSALTLLVLWPVHRGVPAGRPAQAAVARVGARGAVLALAVGAFAVNMSLTGLLFVSPLLVAQAAPEASYPLVVTLMVLPASAGMFLTSRMADKGAAAAVGVGAGILLALTPLPFLGTPGAAAIVVAGAAYFVGHAALSALLPALAAAVAPAHRRGAAQGIQSTLQYFGSFAGSSLVGALWPHATALAVVFLATGALAGATALLGARRAA